MLSSDVLLPEFHTTFANVPENVSTDSDLSGRGEKSCDSEATAGSSEADFVNRFLEVVVELFTNDNTTNKW